MYRRLICALAAAPLLLAQMALLEPQARGRSGGDDRAYRAGQAALERSQWDRALQSFSEVARDSSRADAALYWKAYSLNKLGRRDEALAALAELQKSFASSPWINDGKALELEIRQTAGQSVRPENQADEDLKLMAINGLMNSDPERAVPLLEQVLQGSNPPKVKERALFVLMQSNSARARDVVAGMAKGKGNPDLQMKAVEYLGLFGGSGSRQALSDIYTGTSDTNVKRQVLKAFMLGHDRDRLVAAAKTEQNPELRKEAIRQLGLTGAPAQLAELYQSESSPEVKKTIINGLFLSGAADKIGELARNEKDSALRLEAIQKLGLMGSRTAADLTSLYSTEGDKQVRKAVLNALFLQGNTNALLDVARKETDPELKTEAIKKLGLMGKTSGDALVALYQADTNKEVRRAVIQALFLQNNAKPLVDIARKETDPELKRHAVQQLSLMHSKEGTAYMMEILK